MDDLKKPNQPSEQEILFEKVIIHYSRINSNIGKEIVKSLSLFIEKTSVPEKFIFSTQKFISWVCSNIPAVVFRIHPELNTDILLNLRSTNDLKTMYYILTGISSRNLYNDSVDVFSCRHSGSYKFFDYISYLHLEDLIRYPNLFKLNISNNGPSKNVFTVLVNNSNANHYLPSANHSKSKIDVNSIVYPNAALQVLKRNIDVGVSSPTSFILEGLNYTFGLEIETFKGLVPEIDYKDLNVTCLYDGSLKDEDGVAKGGEYVTGVLQGDAGINNLKKLINTLIKNGCEINHLCSIHVHIGNCNFDKDTLLAMYMLGLSLESELFSLMPQSRINNTYCKQLRNVLDDKAIETLNEIYDNSESEIKIPFKTKYNKIIDYIFDSKLFPYIKYGANVNFSSGNNDLYPDRKFNKHSNHPGGNKCGYDKNAQRYCWLNFVTCLFNNRGLNAKTLEFRLHSGTLNFKKILAWLKICMAFTWFAENHKKSIFLGKHTFENGDVQSITLDLILKLCYPKGHEVLINYVNERKELFNSKKSDQKQIELMEYQESLNLVQSFKLKELLET